MRVSTLLLAVAVAVAAAAAPPLRLSAGEAETEPRVAPPPPAEERSVERPRADRTSGRRSEIRWRRSVAVGSPTAAG
jgi:hypothetical protein